MFTGLPGGLSSLLAAQAATFNKGQQTQSSSSDELRDKARKRDQFILLAQSAEKDKKTQNAKEGFLA